MVYKKRNRDLPEGAEKKLKDAKILIKEVLDARQKRRDNKKAKDRAKQAGIDAKHSLYLLMFLSS